MLPAASFNKNENPSRFPHNLKAKLFPQMFGGIQIKIYSIVWSSPTTILCDKVTFLNIQDHTNCLHQCTGTNYQERFLFVDQFEHGISDDVAQCIMHVKKKNLHLVQTAGYTGGDVPCAVCCTYIFQRTFPSLLSSERTFLKKISFCDGNTGSPSDFYCMIGMSSACCELQ